MVSHKDYFWLQGVFCAIKPLMWFIYVVECSDGSLYTGITTDVDRRIHEHNNTSRGAKYTRSRRPVTLIAFSQCACRSSALKREIAFKKLSKKQKVLELNAW